jgi:hypothetical protein
MEVTYITRNDGHFYIIKLNGICVAYLFGLLRLKEMILNKNLNYILGRLVGNINFLTFFESRYFIRDFVVTVEITFTMRLVSILVLRIKYLK